MVNGLTVKRNSPATGLVVAVFMPDPPLVRVPPFALGEPFGRTCVVAILNVVGPFAKPSTRRTYNLKLDRYIYGGVDRECTAGICQTIIEGSNAAGKADV